MKAKGEQLKLFMPASEYLNHIDSSSDRANVTRGYTEISPNVRMPHPGRETMDEMWARKEAEAREPKNLKLKAGGTFPNSTHGAGVYDSIKERGLQQGHPYSDITVHVDKATGEKRQGEGHHRVVAAAALEKETGKTVWVSPTYNPANLPKQLS
jgi:hypothetical protein